MLYGKKLRELRKIEGWSQEEVAKKLGVSKQTYSHYENEKRKPSLNMIRELASVYKVNIDEIFAEDPGDDFFKLPIVGSISCGNGVLAYQDIEGYEYVPKTWLNGGEYFYLRAKGDSMINARIQEGDLLLIRKQEEVENGEIAAVLINGEAILKRVYISEDAIILQSENPKYPPIILDEQRDIKIIGKLKKVVLNF
ncbi:LexA repressor 1 [Heyndrickxia sporothermodurans]|nr:LexA repressor 1 [Heyndrickxia sporothermodurans]